MNCRDFREIVDSYLCDELLTETNHDVLRHLENCADCRAVIETRRALRTKIKSAVVNSAQFQIRDDFYNSLYIKLKQSSTAAVIEKKPFWTINKSWMAFAASLIFAAGLSFWFLQIQPENRFSTNPAQTNQEVQKTTLAEAAAGDHLNCAVKYNLAETPVDIDLASAQYSDLRRAVLIPLQNSTAEYEFVESHNCKFQGRLFTHLVFRHQGGTISILLTDLQNYPALQNNEIAEIVSNGYQVARFDIKNKAVFVVSDLSERENLTTAKILENPVNQQFLSNDRAKISLIGRAERPELQGEFISR